MGLAGFWQVGKKRVSTESWPWRKNSPSTLDRTWTCNLLITSLALLPLNCPCLVCQGKWHTTPLTLAALWRPGSQPWRPQACGEHGTEPLQPGSARPPGPPPVLSGRPVSGWSASLCSGQTVPATRQLCTEFSPCSKTSTHWVHLQTGTIGTASEQAQSESQSGNLKQDRQGREEEQSNYIQNWKA